MIVICSRNNNKLYFKVSELTSRAVAQSREVLLSFLRPFLDNWVFIKLGSSHFKNTSGKHWVYQCSINELSEEDINCTQ